MSNPRSPMGVEVHRTGLPGGLQIEFMDRPVGMGINSQSGQIRFRAGADRWNVLFRDSWGEVLNSARLNTEVYTGCDSSPAKYAMRRSHESWTLLADYVYQDWSDRARQDLAGTPPKMSMNEAVALMRSYDYPVYDWSEAQTTTQRLRSAFVNCQKKTDDSFGTVGLWFGRHRMKLRTIENVFERSLYECFVADGAGTNFWSLAGEYADWLEEHDHSRTPDALLILRSGIFPLPWEYGLEDRTT